MKLTRRAARRPRHLKFVAFASVAVASAVLLAACGSDNEDDPQAAAPKDCAKGSLTAQGSTAQKNAMAEWVKAYQQKCTGSTINYQGTGSSAGIQALIAGTADFAGSDSALKDDEQTKADARCKTGAAVHLPTVIGPIAVVYNLGVDGLQLKPTTLAKIFSGKISQWDDEAIKADNPGKDLPGTAISPVHRSDGSGTTDNFTAFLTKTAAADWTYGKAKEWKAPGGVGAKGSDGIASTVKQTTGAISYVELSFAEVSGLKKSKVANGSGEYVELTKDSAAKTIESAEVTGKDGDLKLSIDYATKAAGAYPIVLVTYEIVCSKGNPADKLPLLKSFLGYAASAEAQAKLTSIGYAPLPETVRAKVATAVSNLG